jgi:hypothetical protein
MTDNTMAKRKRRTGNTMAKRKRRTGNTMAKRKRRTAACPFTYCSTYMQGTL